MDTAVLPRPKARRLWTYDELAAQMPETNLPVELWNGEVIVSPAQNPDHQRIVSKLWKKLDRFVEERGLGEVFFSPVDVVLTQRRVVQPDVLFISKNRLGIVKQYIEGSPDLVMEVISAGSWQRDRIEKKALYEQMGLPEYWIIDPDSRTIEVFALVKGVYQLHSRAAESQTAKSKLLSGFSVTVQEMLG